MNRRHKYLENLGINRSGCPGNYTYGFNIIKNIRAFRYARKYGFPQGDTWDLDCTFYCWLYEHLKAFRDVAFDIVDMEDTNLIFVFKDKKYNQLELLDKIIFELEWLISDDFAAYNNLEDYNSERIYDIVKMWAIILPSMWW